jgi:hypothetical protein
VFCYPRLAARKRHCWPWRDREPRARAAEGNTWAEPAFESLIDHPSGEAADSESGPPAGPQTGLDLLRSMFLPSERPEGHVAFTTNRIQWGRVEYITVPMAPPSSPALDSGIRLPGFSRPPWEL